MNDHCTSDVSATFLWASDTEIVPPRDAPAPIRHAIRILERDMRMTLRAREDASASARTRIEIHLAGEGDPIYGERETFSYDFTFEPGNREARTLRVVGSDDLGLVFGILNLSTSTLGVDPFWFWMDRDPIEIGEARMAAKPYR